MVGGGGSSTESAHACVCCDNLLRCQCGSHVRDTGDSPSCPAGSLSPSLTCSALVLMPGWSAGPCIVQVFPDPVCPYASIQALYPSAQLRTRGATSSKTCRRMVQQPHLTCQHGQLHCRWSGSAVNHGACALGVCIHVGAGGMVLHFQPCPQAATNDRHAQWHGLMKMMWMSRVSLPAAERPLLQTPHQTQTPAVVLSTRPAHTAGRPSAR